MLRKALISGILICLMFCLGGCNAFRGLGKDVQGLGRGIEDLSNAEVYWAE
ncbi:MAG: entericidin EcnA/B family protein [Candidatus Brocadiia bacterium]|nr:MAG: entericidin EcnA/B family protein [Candidatus Brocadiia bacterium]